MSYARGNPRGCKSLIVRPLAIVRVVFVALPTPVDGVARVTRRAIPLLAAPLALDEILLGVLRGDGLIQPFVTHHIKLRPRTRVGLEDLLTSDHISHNRKQYSTDSENVNPFLYFFLFFFRSVSCLLSRSYTRHKGRGPNLF